MIKANEFYKILQTNGIRFYCGVPDSLLKEFLTFLSDTVDNEKHIITSNEGNAIALAAGYYLAQRNPALVYMQNSGQGNALNPLVSLMDKDVFNIPVLLMIGWRGKPGVRDEPQHVKQGKITISLLDVLGIEHSILDDNITEVNKQVKYAIDYMKKTNEPYALVAQKDTFIKYKPKSLSKNKTILKREKAVKIVAEHIEEQSIIVSTTGKISRELYEHRSEKGQKHNRDFYTVGSMGHCSQIALGIALCKKNLPVYCFDGDGSFIMHMGGITTIGDVKPQNFRHIVFNNCSHDSVGGQRTSADTINIGKIAKNCGYTEIFTIGEEDELKNCITNLKDVSGPVLVEVIVAKGSRSNLARPTTSPIDNKIEFMDLLRDYD